MQHLTMRHPVTDIAPRLLEMARRLLMASRAPAHMLEPWPAPTGARRLLAPSELPVLRWLAAALSLAPAAARPLVEAIVDEAGALAWRQTYTADDLGQPFLDRYGWTEFAGFRGPIASETVAIGVLVLGPETVYPQHSHAAEEVYLPVAGTAEWLKGDEGWTPRAPLEMIHHAPWKRHAMRTGAEPLLAIYVWRGGDLAAKSRLEA
jgi:hypothetical protein